MKLRVGRGTVWQRKIIDGQKRLVKAHLDGCTDPLHPKSRLRECQRQISALEAAEDSEAQLQRYIYIVSALVQHERVGGLSELQIKRYVKLAYAILRTQGVALDSPKLGFLYGELHWVLSQIRRREGAQWESAWEQQMAGYLSHQRSDSGKAAYSLALGLRSLRLGYTTFASEQLSRCLGKGLASSQEIRARLEAAKACRLLGEMDKAKSFAAPLEGMELRLAERKELRWEALCCEAQEKGQIEGLLESTRKGGLHFDYAYIMEVFLWTRAVKSRQWITRYPTVKQMGRGLKIRPKEYGFWFEAVSLIEQCYDSEIPFMLRLQKVGELLLRTDQFFSIDKEILFWATVCRWLYRNRSSGFGALVLNEYRAKCLKVSEGRTSDVLNVVSDLYEAEPSSLAVAS